MLPSLALAPSAVHFLRDLGSLTERPPLFLLPELPLPCCPPPALPKAQPSLELVEPSAPLAASLALGLPSAGRLLEGAVPRPAPCSLAWRGVQLRWASNPKGDFTDFLNNTIEFHSSASWLTGV